MKVRETDRERQRERERELPAVTLRAELVVCLWFPFEKKRYFDRLACKNQNQ